MKSLSTQTICKLLVRKQGPGKHRVQGGTEFEGCPNSLILIFKGRLNASEIPVLRISDVGQIFWEPLEPLEASVLKYIFYKKGAKKPIAQKCADFAPTASCAMGFLAPKKWTLKGLQTYKNIKVRFF